MRKALTVVLFISLVVLIGLFAWNQLTRVDEKETTEEAEVVAEEVEPEEIEVGDENDDGVITADDFTYEEFDESLEQYVTADSIYVRDLPNEDGAELGTLVKNTQVEIVAQCVETGWYKIEFEEDYGYVSDEYIGDYVRSALPLSDDIVIPTTQKEILFIGNSITFYPGTSDWWGSGYGLGATSIDKDYVHQTVAAMGYTSYDAMSMRNWEFAQDRNTALGDLNKYIKNYAYDIIVIELGENAKGKEANLKEDFIDMITYIKAYNPNAKIVMMDNFWKYSEVISIKKEVASEVGASYVSLSDIQDVSSYQILEGQVYTFEDGSSYTINSFVAGHPNDDGYAAMAQRLVAVLQSL